MADFRSHAIVNLEIKKAFPADQIMAEEDSSALRSSERLKFEVVSSICRLIIDISEDEVLTAIDYGKFTGCSKGRYWAVDPIDGTKGFLRGEQYAVTIGLIENGKVVVGVLGCPNLALDFMDESSEKGSLLVAVQDQGAYMRAYAGEREREIHVSPVKDPAKARFTESYESAHSSHHRSARIAELLAIKKLLENGQPMQICCRYQERCRNLSAALGKSGLSGKGLGSCCGIDYRTGSGGNDYRYQQPGPGLFSRKTIVKQSEYYCY